MTSEEPKIKASYLVCPDKGPYFTIQSAIDGAKQDCIIKIASGVYKESLLITKHGVKLEAKDTNSVYILGNILSL